MPATRGFPVAAGYRAGLACWIAILAAMSPSAAGAQDSVEALGQLSLEQLADVTVTSVSKRAEPLSSAPAAVFVISAEDIHRAGATSLPEALRLAPNLEVAQINTYSYTITARGFNSPESANKILVLIDGRSVYSPLAATVFWDAIDIPVDTIDRIEVISGAGGTLWGANAVNGVINIITKSADAMKGFAFDATAGSYDRTATLSYGGSINDDIAYRAYVNGFDRAPTSAYSPTDLTGDAWRGVQAGARLDGNWGDDTWRAQGAIYSNATHGEDIPRNEDGAWGGNILARWDHAIDEQSSFGVQAYYSQDGRATSVLSELLNTGDIQGQYNTVLWSDHTIAVGGEFRLWHETLHSFNPFGFVSPGATLTLGNLFVQDEFPLTDSLRLTLGFKGEENNYSGFDYLPSARMAWQPDRDDLIWTAISRAVRTPSRIDRELQYPGLLAPAPDFQSESLLAFEAGYRGQFGQRFSLSVSAFFNLYDSLRSDELTGGSALPIYLGNGIAGHSFGLEAWGKYNVLDWWKMSAGVNWLHRDYHLKPGHVDISVFQSIGQDPPWQASLRSEMNVSTELEFDATLRAVGHVMRLYSPAPIELVPAYIEADARIGWVVTPALELSLEGKNLLHNQHLEVYDPSTAPVRYIPRQVALALRARL